MKSLGCVLIGLAQPRISEGLRDWLQASFQGVFIVANGPSLLDGAHKLKPALILVDSELGAGKSGALVAELHQATPESRILLISRCPATVGEMAALSPGRDGILHMETLAQDLAAAVDAVLEGQDFSTPAQPAGPDRRPGSVAPTSQ